MRNSSKPGRRHSPERTHQSAVQDFTVKWEPTDQKYHKTPVYVFGPTNVPMKYQLRDGEGVRKILQVHPRNGQWNDDVIAAVIRDWAATFFPTHELVLESNAISAVTE